MTGTLTDGSKAIIFEHLRGVGVVKITASYSGSGDSGCLDGIEAFDTDGKTILIPDSIISVATRQSVWQTTTRTYVIETTEPYDIKLGDAIEQWCYDLLEDHYGGWQDNEGADGQIIFDVEKCCGRIEHTAHYTASEWSEVEFT